MYGILNDQHDFFNHVVSFFTGTHSNVTCVKTTHHPPNLE